MKRSRLGEVLVREGLRRASGRNEETGFGERVDPAFAAKRGLKKGAIEQLYPQPPEIGAVICLDERGPESAKSVPGQQVVNAAKRSAARARQAIAYGRRGSGDVFGAFVPATGAALTWTAERRTTANFVTFLELAETWIDPTVERVYAILDHLHAHRATDVLLFALAHPRGSLSSSPSTPPT